MLRKLAFAMMLAAAPAAIASPVHNWQLYQNPRFGTLAELPADLFRNAATSDNGDGATWTAPGGASLRIFGFWNALEQTPARYEAFLRKGTPSRYAGITYKVVKRNFLVLSGADHGVVFYERYAFGDPSGAIHALVLEYPGAVRATFDPVVGRISTSLRWGGSSAK